MKIGCINLVPFDNESFWAIECAKGRGIILPSGKFDAGLDKTLHDCAKRELLEETGIEADLRLLWNGFNVTDGYYIYCFTSDGYCGQPRGSYEGRVVTATWSDLLKSEFEPTYLLIKDVYEAHRISRRSLL